VAIGFLPTYESIGILAPILLALFRFGQGLGLGGEWGGAVLLATENAPEGKRAWYGMFPQMGAPIGFLLSSGTFLILSNVLTDQEFFEFGWRIPFIASAVLVFVGLYVRLKIEETPEFLATMKNNQRVQMPIMEVFKAHTRTLIFATLLSITTFALFYLMTVFTLSWGTSVLHYPRSSFLIAQMIAVVFFAIGVPLSALLADRYGCTRVLMGAMLAVITFGLFFAPLFTVANWTMTVVFLALGLLLMGFTYGPLGTALGLLFPTEVRYTGSSLAFTLAGILGASLAPYIATWLATHYGLEFVGYYLALAATLSFLALVAVRHRLK
jgi:MFS family permease